MMTTCIRLCIHVVPAFVTLNCWRSQLKRVKTSSPPIFLCESSEHLFSLKYYCIKKTKAYSCAVSVDCFVSYQITCGNIGCAFVLVGVGSFSIPSSASFILRTRAHQFCLWRRCTVRTQRLLQCPACTNHRWPVALLPPALSPVLEKIHPPPSTRLGGQCVSPRVQLLLQWNLRGGGIAFVFHVLVLLNFWLWYMKKEISFHFKNPECKIQVALPGWVPSNLHATQSYQ